MDKVTVKPREGVKVRTEDGSRFIKETGEPVPLTTYYRRRLTDGDLIEGKGGGSEKAVPAKSGPRQAKKGD